MLLRVGQSGCGGGGGGGGWQTGVPCLYLLAEEEDELQQRDMAIRREVRGFKFACLDGFTQRTNLLWGGREGGREGGSEGGREGGREREGGR